MGDNDINKRVILWIMYLIDSKIYKSEAEYLRSVGMGVAKLSDARKGKAGFRPDDIGKILIKDGGLNADWVMTGRGEMLIDKSNVLSNNSDSDLHLSIFNKLIEVQNELTHLKIENSELKQKLGISNVG